MRDNKLNISSPSNTNTTSATQLLPDKQIWEIRFLEHCAALSLKSLLYIEILEGLKEGIERGIVAPEEKGMFLSYISLSQLIPSLHERYIKHKDKIRDTEMINLLVYYYHLDCYLQTIEETVGRYQNADTMKRNLLYIDSKKRVFSLYKLLGVEMITDTVEGMIKGTVRAPETLSRTSRRN